jgi:hypothetical protein
MVLMVTHREAGRARKVVNSALHGEVRSNIRLYLLTILIELISNLNRRQNRALNHEELVMVVPSSTTSGQIPRISRSTFYGRMGRPSFQSSEAS